MNRFWNAIRHGLALDEAEKPREDELLFIDKIATEAKHHHLAFPLLIFVEGLRPAAILTASLLKGLEPFAELFFPQETYAKLVDFVAKRSNLDLLIDKLED